MNEDNSETDVSTYLSPGVTDVHIHHSNSTKYLDFLAIQSPRTEGTMIHDESLSETDSLPEYEASKAKLPQPYWQNHERVIQCYWKVWQLVMKNLRKPQENSTFVCNYIDTAFNDCLFMWDSVFILAYTRYGRHVFDFQQTLDNLYANQLPDGFITRELRRDGSFQFHPFDPASTGPNLLGWSEWMHWQTSKDILRLRRVFPVILRYHRWMRTHRTWQNGTYWSCGLGCGMDNQPRVPAGYQPLVHHGHMTWLDATAQAALSAHILIQIANVLETPSEEIKDLYHEHTHLKQWIQTNAWDEATGYMYDVLANGKRSSTKSIAAFWVLLAQLVDDEEKINRICQHLQNPEEFCRVHRVPTLSADHPKYNQEGGYWCGAVWPPTNYLVLSALHTARKNRLAHEIALNHIDCVTATFKKTGTVWENYSPENADNPGNPAKPDFCGWSGLGPVAILFEYVFGLQPDAQNNLLIWDIRLLDSFGIKQYPYGPGDGMIDLHCEARDIQSDKPHIHGQSNIDLTIRLYWGEDSPAETRLFEDIHIKKNEMFSSHNDDDKI